MSHRKPPKPKSWNCKRGTCRYCGEAIIEDGKQNNRKHWHTQCGELWSIMNNPSEARKFILKRDKKTCQECGRKHISNMLDPNYVDFDVDHVKPLFEAHGNHSYWQPENLILLCKPCHLVKTRTDMEKFRANKKVEDFLFPKRK